jgi:hypothetical protein
MSQSAVVLAVPHRIQGPNFQGYIEDRSYAPFVKRLMYDHMDFVFEEAAGYGPSIAEQLAKTFQRPLGYLDIDPTPDERLKYGIAKVVGCGGPVDPCNSPDVYETSKVDEQGKREQVWVNRITESHFQKGLVIVGLAHSLSIAFRLVAAGVSVIDTYDYTPYSKLCGHATR